MCRECYETITAEDVQRLIDLLKQKSKDDVLVDGWGNHTIHKLRTVLRNTPVRMGDKQ